MLAGPVPHAFQEDTLRDAVEIGPQVPECDSFPELAGHAIESLIGQSLG
jgi:hypothetical protein